MTTIVDKEISYFKYKFRPSLGLNNLNFLFTKKTVGVPTAVTAGLFLETLKISTTTSSGKDKGDLKVCYWAYF